MRHRIAKLSDAPLLARLNRELIEDEGHEAPVSLAALEARLRSWLAGEYTAIVFELGGAPVAYALFREHESRGIYLRHFHVSRAHRRQHIGTRAFRALRSDVLAPGTRITLEVLSGNDVAFAFWRSLGFADYAVTMELDGDRTT